MDWFYITLIVLIIMAYGGDSLFRGFGGRGREKSYAKGYRAGFKAGKRVGRSVVESRAVGDVNLTKREEPAT